MLERLRTQENLRRATVVLGVVYGGSVPITVFVMMRAGGSLIGRVTSGGVAVASSFVAWVLWVWLLSLFLPDRGEGVQP